MSIANGHLYVNGLIVAKVSSREQRNRQSEANETDRLGRKKRRHWRSKKRMPKRGNKTIVRLDSCPPLMFHRLFPLFAVFSRFTRTNIYFLRCVASVDKTRNFVRRSSLGTTRHFRRADSYRAE